MKCDVYFDTQKDDKPTVFSHFTVTDVDPFSEKEMSAAAEQVPAGWTITEVGYEWPVAEEQSR